MKIWRFVKKIFSPKSDKLSIFNLSKINPSKTVEYEILTHDNKHLVQVKIPIPYPIPQHPKSEVYLLMFAKPLLSKVVEKVLEKEGLEKGKINILRAIVREDYIHVIAEVNIKNAKE